MPHVIDDSNTELPCRSHERAILICTPVLSWGLGLRFAIICCVCMRVVHHCMARWFTVVGRALSSCGWREEVQNSQTRVPLRSAPRIPNWYTGSSTHPPTASRHSHRHQPRTARCRNNLPGIGSWHDSGVDPRELCWMIRGREIHCCVSLHAFVLFWGTVCYLGVAVQNMTSSAEVPKVYHQDHEKTSI